MKKGGTVIVAKFLIKIWLLIYLTVYFILSWNGHYAYANHGGADNRKTWHPAYCAYTYIAFSGRQREALSLVGRFFFPLILFDRLIMHPTQEATDACFPADKLCLTIKNRLRYS